MTYIDTPRGKFRIAKEFDTVENCYTFAIVDAALQGVCYVRGEEAVLFMKVVSAYRDIETAADLRRSKITLADYHTVESTLWNLRREGLPHEHEAA